jgi:hypothetical protein
MRIIRAATIFADMATLTAVNARRMRAIADGLSRPVRRARDIYRNIYRDISRNLFGLSTSRAGSSDAGKPHPIEFDSLDHGTAAEAYLPTGPSCC